MDVRWQASAILGLPDKITVVKTGIQKARDPGFASGAYWSN